MKIGIVGCGLNSDYHIKFAKGYPGVDIVGVVDREPSKASACASRHGIKAYYSSIADLCSTSRPDVLHVITPPASHFSVANEALEAGCNILIEKPLTLNLSDAKRLYEHANKKNLKICAMHNHFFDPCMMKARSLIESGAAGHIINIESYYGLNTRIDAFRKYPMPNVLPWLYSMPGGVYHDFMPHPLYVMLPYTGRVDQIAIMEKSFGEMPQCISDELRILVKGEKAFGILTFSFAARPFQHFIKYYGTRMTITVNIDTMTTVVHPVSSLPKAAQKATFNLTESKQLFTSTMKNVYNFATGKLRPYQGMRTLIHAFYEAVEKNSQVPVPEEDALRVIEVMDRLWPEIKNKELSFERIIPGTMPDDAKQRPRILVTGATGFLGRKLVQTLTEQNYRVRCLVRKLSNIESLRRYPVEIFFGDVADKTSLTDAFQDIDIVVHAAADTAGRQDESETATIRGTELIIELCRTKKIKKLIYISSCSVYGVSDYRNGEIVTEESSLERHPELRGVYSEAKLKAENMITAEMKNGLPAVCLRPGTYFGPGGDIYTPMMGLGFGNLFLIIGNGKKFELPLIFIDNLIDAIITCIEKDKSAGRVYNVVDTERVNKRQYVDVFLRKVYPRGKFIFLPYRLFYSLVYVQEKLTGLMGMKPFLTRYRTISSQKPIVYSNERMRNELNWNPPISLKQAIENVIASTKK